MDEKERILIVDDDESTCKTLTLIFGKKGYETEMAGTGQEALEKAQERPFNLALLDIKLPDMAGVELLTPLKEMHPDMVAIMVTAYASLETAVQALNEGASAYITKPLNMDVVLATVREALEKQRLVMEKRRAEEEAQQRATLAVLAYEVGQRVSAKLELDELLSEIVTAVRDTFDYYGVMILLVDEESKCLTMRSIAGGYADIFPADIRHAIGEGMTGYAAASGETQVSGDVSQDPHYVREADEETKSELAVPIQSGERVIGVLDIQSDEFDAFDETDVMAMETLADQVAVAIENARLYGAVEHELAERKRVEEALRDSEMKNRALIQAMPDTLFRVSRDGTFLDIPTGDDSALALPRSALIGKRADELFPEDLANMALEAAERALESGALQVLEYQMPIPLGTENRRDFEARIVPCGPDEVLAIARDITERKRAEKALQESQRSLEAVVETAPSLIVLTDPDGRIVLFNRACEELTGYRREEVIGKTIPELFLPPEWIPIVQKRFADPYAPEVRAPHENPWITKSGEERLIEWRCTVLPSPEDGRPCVLGTGVDTTERKRAEEALQQSERELSIRNRIAEIFLTIPDEEMYGEMLRVVLEATESKYGIFGYIGEDGALVCPSMTRDVWERCQIPDKDIVFPRQTWGGLWGYALVEKKTLYSNKPLRVPEGHIPILRALDVPIIHRREVIGNLLVGNKATDYDKEDFALLEAIASYIAPILHARLQRDREERERKQAVEALRVSEERFALAVHGSNDGIWDWDIQNNSLYWSPRLKELLGYAEDELDVDFDTFESHLHPDDREHTRATIEARLKDRGLYDVEQRLRTKSGEYRWFRVRGQALWDEAGNPIRMVGFTTDVTHRKQHERELQAIATVSTALRTAPTRVEMLPVILDQLMDLLNADGVALATRDPATDETVIELARRDWTYWSGERLLPGEGISGQVIASGQPYVNNDLQVDPLFGRPDMRFDLRAVACVPLIAQEQTIGALWVGRQSDITAEEVRLLTAIGDMAANAIHRATLHEQTERRLQRLTALREIDMAITASLDLGITLNVLLDKLTAQLGVDAADILLFNPHIQTLEYAAGRGFRSPAVQRSPVRLGEELAGRAALERQTISIADLRLVLSEAKDLKSAIQAEGFVAYYGVPLMAKGEVKGVLEIFHRTPLPSLPPAGGGSEGGEWLDFLQAIATQAAIAMDNAKLFADLQRSNIELTLSYDTTLEGWARALELRDYETEGHTRRVTELTMRLVHAMGISDTDASAGLSTSLAHVRRGALLHDIGKLAIPDTILFKPGPLAEEEWRLMRQHPVYAYELLSPIAYLRPALDIPYCHHEKWDGTGYPRGMKGEQIPLAARIFAVVDVWDALLSDRPYRPAWPEEKVIEYVREQAGKHFDPLVVEVFLRMPRHEKWGDEEKEENF